MGTHLFLAGLLLLLFVPLCGVHAALGKSFLEMLQCGNPFSWADFVPLCHTNHSQWLLWGRSVQQKIQTIVQLSWDPVAPLLLPRVELQWELLGGREPEPLRGWEQSQELFLGTVNRGINNNH